jgi:hypothetical protein
MRLLIFAIAALLLSRESFAQGCCSGGSGSPVAGGTSQGVLADRQAEIAMNYQYINSDKFLTGDKPVMNFLKNYNTEYLYSRFAYGVTKSFTMSLESGYFLNKTQIGLGNDKVTGSGIGDLIIFPRYDVYTHNTEKTRDEITVGIGDKIPIGKYLDSSVVFTDPITGKNYYTPKPPAVMSTNGSNDFIFYGFAFRGYPEKKFRLFTSILYVRKGWNPLGQKFGDYASVGLFAGKTFFKKLGVTLQLKGEWVDIMKYNHNIDMLARYNLDVTSTGGKRVLFVPQLGYSYKSFSFFALSEIPLYQYVNGTAIASQYLFTFGVSYRFFTVKQNG